MQQSSLGAVSDKLENRMEMALLTTSIHSYPVKSACPSRLQSGGVEFTQQVAVTVQSCLAKPQKTFKSEKDAPRCELPIWLLSPNLHENHNRQVCIHRSLILGFSSSRNQVCPLPAVEEPFLSQSCLSQKDFKEYYYWAQNITIQEFDTPQHLPY